MILIHPSRSVVRMAEYLLATKGPNSPEYKRILKLHPLSYAGLAGTFGAQSVMFAKSTAELLESSFKGTGQFHRPLAWVIILTMLVTIFLQVRIVFNRRSLLVLTTLLDALSRDGVEAF